MFVVSPNYRDRKSELRWLYRKDTERPDRAHAVPAIQATRVHFTYSHEFEVGFSCDMVAVCEKVDTSRPADELELVQIFFHKNEDPTMLMGFYIAGTKNRIHGCKHLVLKTNGTMFAVLN